MRTVAVWLIGFALTILVGEAVGVAAIVASAFAMIHYATVQDA